MRIARQVISCQVAIIPVRYYQSVKSYPVYKDSVTVTDVVVTDDIKLLMVIVRSSRKWGCILPLYHIVDLYIQLCHTPTVIVLFLYYLNNTITIHSSVRCPTV